MEKVEGVTLGDWLTTDHNFIIKYNIFLQLAKTMYSVHGQGVYHGDLHPRNVLIDCSDAVKIIDFGSSIACGSKEQLQVNESVNIIRTTEALFLPQRINDLFCVETGRHSAEQVLAAVHTWGQALWVFRELRIDLETLKKKEGDDENRDDYGVRNNLFGLAILMESEAL